MIVNVVDDVNGINKIKLNLLRSELRPAAHNKYNITPLPFGKTTKPKIIHIYCTVIADMLVHIDTDIVT